MRPGPPRGETATLEVTVTDAMASRLAGTSLPPVCRTPTLVRLVEEVCRRVLTPHLEPDEVGVGTHVDLTHRAPVPVGATITLTATVAQVGQQRLVCEVLVRDGSRLVARGSFEHEVVTRSDLAGELAAG